jgi:hypothetical protein
MNAASILLDESVPRSVQAALQRLGRDQNQKIKIYGREGPEEREKLGLGRLSRRSARAADFAIGSRMRLRNTKPTRERWNRNASRQAFVIETRRSFSSEPLHNEITARELAKPNLTLKKPWPN